MKNRALSRVKRAGLAKWMTPISMVGVLTGQTQASLASSQHARQSVTSTAASSVESKAAFAMDLLSFLKRSPKTGVKSPYTDIATNNPAWGYVALALGYGLLQPDAPHRFGCADAMTASMVAGAIAHLYGIPVTKSWTATDWALSVGLLSASDLAGTATTPITHTRLLSLLPQLGAWAAGLAEFPHSWTLTQPQMSLLSNALANTGQATQYQVTTMTNRQSTITLTPSGLEDPSYTGLANQVAAQGVTVTTTEIANQINGQPLLLETVVTKPIPAQNLSAGTTSHGSGSTGTSGSAGTARTSGGTNSKSTSAATPKPKVASKTTATAPTKVALNTPARTEFVDGSTLYVNDGSGWKSAPLTSAIATGLESLAGNLTLSGLMSVKVSPADPSQANGVFDVTKASAGTTTKADGGTATTSGTSGQGSTSHLSTPGTSAASGISPSGSPTSMTYTAIIQPGILAKMAASTLSQAGLQVSPSMVGTLVHDTTGQLTITIAPNAGVGTGLAGTAGHSVATASPEGATNAAAIVADWRIVKEQWDIEIRIPGADVNASLGGQLTNSDNAALVSAVSQWTTSMTSDITIGYANVPVNVPSGLSLPSAAGSSGSAGTK